MIRRLGILAATIAGLLFTTPDAIARGGYGGGHGGSRSGGGHNGGTTSHSSSHTRSSSPHTSKTGHVGTTRHTKAVGVQRDHHGKIHRSTHAKNEFKKAHPCPSTGRSSGGCPGYVIDHVKPLKRGGADELSNMQWQTVSEAKAKDKWE